jgi:hypothetical protein
MRVPRMRILGLSQMAPTGWPASGLRAGVKVRWRPSLDPKDHPFSGESLLNNDKVNAWLTQLFAY